MRAQSAIFTAAVAALIVLSVIGAPAALASGEGARAAQQHEIDAAQRPAPPLPGPEVAPGVRPSGFWLSSTQAIALAARQPVVRELARTAGLHGHAAVAALGLWAIVFERGGQVLTSARVEDRTGVVLPVNEWTWTPVGSKLDTYKRRLETVLAILAAGFLIVFFDWRRPLALVNLDLLVLLSFGASLLALDRMHPLLSVPLAYPPLGYLLLRLLIAGWRGTRSRPALARWASARTLLAGVVLLEALRVGFSLVYPATADVGYASVFGANSIHHGLAIYSPLPFFHLDTYGPVNYLAYLPFELLFPMGAGWGHDSLPAAHAASLAFELATVTGLFVLGRRLRAGYEGSRLGAALAFGWVAYPFTLLPFAQNSNDGLIAALLVWALIALGSPLARGVLFGMATAAKFTPVALFGLLAVGRGDRRRREVPLFALAAGAVVAISIWAYLPHPGGLQLFWDKTIGYQLGRHSFMSLWGQHPGLGFLRSAVLALTVATAAAALVLPRRRDDAQVAALAGAIVIGLEICLRYWSLFYVAWFVPCALVGLFAAARIEPIGHADRVHPRPRQAVAAGASA